MHLLATLPHKLLSVGRQDVRRGPRVRCLCHMIIKCQVFPRTKLQHKAQPYLQPAPTEGPGHWFPFGTVENCEMVSG